MNKPTSDLPFSLPTSLTVGGPGLSRLFDHIAEGAAERERDRILPYESIDLIRQARLGALRISLADGGGGASFRELFEVMIRLAAADANVAHIMRNHFTITEQYARRPRDTQGREWQKAVVEGAIIGLANTELESSKVGGDARLATTLTPDGAGYRLNGTKYYSTGAIFADYVLVRAADVAGAPVSAIIPTKRDGVELLDDWDGAGQRLTGSGTTRLVNVWVEKEEAVFDVTGIGYGLAYANTQSQLFLTAVNAGIIRGILADAVALLRRRSRPFYYAPTERVADDPVLQQIAGQIASNAFVAEASVLAAADALDRTGTARDKDEPDAEFAANAALAAAKAKVVVDELAIRSGSLLFDVGGASAMQRVLNLDRHWRNARTLASHNPSSYKARAIGDFEINGTPLPAKGFF